MEKENRRKRKKKKIRRGQRKQDYYGEIEELLDPLTKSLNSYSENNLNIANQSLDVFKSNEGEVQAKPYKTIYSKIPQSIYSTQLKNAKGEIFA